MSKRTIAVKPESEPRPARQADWEIVEPGAPANFASFSWSITEVASVGGRTRIRSRTTRWTDGKLASERFEGELESGAYQRLAAQAQAQFAEQVRALMQPMRWLWPSFKE
ncbi:hypothetical protein [Variovorax ginsengisoli]|uniref:Uncharacterized protein n=1 Tax=Variovorax ginsengisoli TaxID=363844 RepID=A0ABT8S5H7_9BURK|nr:hypothetical protein [Variovorax ginsengisoli]MDN8615009.1 hypothetical protein [Variovorax ginsengisoli]MDO1534179.1 hypothetical protein [Variovorax ginsengisoli]